MVPGVVGDQLGLADGGDVGPVGPGVGDVVGLVGGSVGGTDGAPECNSDMLQK